MPVDTAGIMQAIRSLPVVSSHTHHALPERHGGMTVDRLLSMSYVGWCGIAAGTAEAERSTFVDQLGANTYFLWLSRALAEIYGQGEVTAANWEAISAALEAAHSRPDHHIGLLAERCRYRYAVLDAYWDPGSDNGRPDLFRPTYRINQWAMCPRPGLTDHNGNSPWNTRGFAPANLAEYLDAFETAVEASVGAGAVALKSALAYDRTVEVRELDLEAARRAFSSCEGGTVLGGDLLAFGDVVFDRACRVARRLGLPFQVHVGLAKLAGSRPLLLEATIARHPEVTFHLFHGGYPWCGEVGALLHNYGNVVADMCWLPLISTECASRYLGEFLDVARSSERIVWGDDAWTGEEAYGALLAWEHVVARVLGQRVADGLYTPAQAERLAHKLMYANAEKLLSSA